MRIVRYHYPAYRGAVRHPSHSGRSPWTGFEAEIDRLFNAAITPRTSTQFPVDLYEDASNAYVRAEMPGFNREGIEVGLTDGELTIKATREKAAEAGQEKESAAVTRTLTVPADVAADRVSAAYEDGVLTVTLPKREETKPKKISVAVN